MGKTCLSILIMLLLLAFPAAAEFYKYRDAQGNVHFTDDLSQVPEAQRPKAESYIDYRGVPQEQPASSKEEAAPAAGESSPKDSLQQGMDLEAARVRLTEIKANLDKAYYALVGEKKNLEEEKPQIRNQAQLNDYNDKVTKLNEKMAAYEERRKTYDVELKAYNARVQRLLEQPALQQQAQP